MIAVIAAAVALPLLAEQEETPDLDVPYVPTHKGAVDAMLKLAKVTAKDYVIDVRVIDNRIRIFVDGGLSADIEDTARAARPLKGGYFGLRNFTKGTRTWYDYVKVYRLAE